MDCSARQQRATEEWWTQHNQKWQENQDQNGQKADGAWKRAKKKMKKQNERTEHVFTKRFIFLYFCWCRKVCLRDINIHVHIYTHTNIYWRKKFRLNTAERTRPSVWLRPYHRCENGSGHPDPQRRSCVNKNNPLPVRRVLISPLPVLWCHSVLCFQFYSTSWMQLCALFLLHWPKKILKIVLKSF